MAWEEMEQGEYHDWDCLNELYGLVQAGSFAGLARVLRLVFDGVYDFSRLAERYGELRGGTCQHL